MTLGGLVVQIRKAAQAPNWETFYRYLNQYFSTVSCRLATDAEAAQLSVKPDDLDAYHAETLDIVIQVLREGDFQLRWDLSKLIPNFGTIAIAPLIDLLEDAQDDDDWELSWFIARILGHYPTDQSIVALQRLLQTSSQEDVCAVVIDALASMEEAVLPTLAVLMNDASTRLFAVQALARLQHPDVMSLLMTVVHDDDARTRAVAIATLGQFHQPEITQRLIEALSDVASDVRCAAVVGVGLQHQLLPAEKSLEVLTPLLWDVNLDVRRQTVLALGRLKTEQSAQVLFETLCSADTPPMLWGDILRALVWTGTTTALNHLQRLVNRQFVESPRVLVNSNDCGCSRAHERSSECPPDINPCFPDVSSQLQVLHGLATTLGLVETPQLQEIASDILIDMLVVIDGNDTYSQPSWRSRVVSIKQAIVYNLGHLKQHRAVPSLKALLISDPDKRIQLHTTRALEQIVGLGQ